MSFKSFNELKKNRSKATEKLNSELSKLNAPQQYEDNENFWYPEVDKAGNGEAIVRFLPAPAGEEAPFIRLFRHSFKGPGGWYIEKSLTTLGQNDPVGEYNTQLWNSGSEEAKTQARNQKRKLEFVANVYIVRDKLNPDNEGKVFRFRFGKKIFDKLNELMNPEFDDDKPINPFDLWEGANFRIRIKNGEGGFRNYDSSKFDEPSEFLKNDEEREAVWKQCHSLAELIDPSKFKTYDELKAKMLRVLGMDSPAVVMAEAKPARVSKAKASSLDEDEDADLIAFKELIAEDDE